MQKVIISVIGQDRPGIIAAVTRVLFDLDFNIENVSQTILQSQFSGIFIAGAPPHQSLQNLAAQLNKNLKPMNLNVFVKELEISQASGKTACEPFVITTKGPDRKGLVAGITAVIADHNANVTNLQAVFRGGDNPAANIMIYEVDIPVQADQQRLRSDLQQKAAELDLDLSMIHKNIFEAINRV